MSEPSSFETLIRRVREGDQQAAAELVQRYEPAIRRAVRFRLSDTRLQAAFDSMDICQSVLASFFVRATAGEYDLERPEQLQGLLTAMAKKKLAMQVRHQRAQRRDNRRAVPGQFEENPMADKASPTPSRQVAARELLQEVHRRLSPEEKQLVEWRNQGVEWAEISKRLGQSAEALRKKLTRALDRVSGELGIDEAEDE